MRPNIGKLFRKLTWKQKAKLNSKGMVKKTINKDGKTTVPDSQPMQWLINQKFQQCPRCGGPRMKASAAYPAGYAKRLFMLHKTYMVAPLQHVHV